MEPKFLRISLKGTNAYLSRGTKTRVQRPKTTKTSQNWIWKIWNLAYQKVLAISVGFTRFARQKGNT